MRPNHTGGGDLQRGAGGVLAGRRVRDVEVQDHAEGQEARQHAGERGCCRPRADVAPKESQGPCRVLPDARKSPRREVLSLSSLLSACCFAGGESRLRAPRCDKQEARDDGDADLRGLAGGGRAVRACDSTRYSMSTQLASDAAVAVRGPGFYIICVTGRSQQPPFCSQMAGTR